MQPGHAHPDALLPAVARSEATVQRKTLIPPFLALLVGASAAWTPAPRAGAQGLRDCSELVIVDADLDSGVPLAKGAVLDLDLDLPVDGNIQVAGGGAGTVFLSHATVAPGRRVFVVDLEADPAGLGPDPGGGPGPGALYEMEPTMGSFSVVADGTACGPTIMNCGATGAFANPMGVAWDPSTDTLVVADIDADPSGLGLDSNGFAGRGAIYRVDRMSGQVDLVADGSNYADPIPGGAPSIFEDPIAVDVARDGTLYVVDQLARPLGAGPVGALFEVDPATGLVSLLAVPNGARGLRDVALEPRGTLLLLDRLAGGSGAIYRVDPALMPPATVVAQSSPPEFVEPNGLVVAGNGDIFVMDSSASQVPFDAFAAVFQLDPTLAAATPVSLDPGFVFPWSLDLLEHESLDSAVPAVGDAGTSPTVRLRGGTFLPLASVDFGPDITVDDVRWVSDTELDVDITIAGGAAAGLRDVVVTNPDLTQAFHCDLFEVVRDPGCAVAGPVGPTLRVALPEPDTVQLSWEGLVDPCLASYRVRRSYRAVPDALPGSWPSDPDFADVGSTGLTTFPHPAVAGEDEYFLVVPVGTDGEEGPSEHYP